jgi:hypothetical protein
MSISLEIPLIQVAGIRDQAEAELLVECGVRYLGFPLRLDMRQEDLGRDRPKGSGEGAGVRGRGQSGIHALANSGTPGHVLQHPHNS